MMALVADLASENLDLSFKSAPGSQAAHVSTERYNRSRNTNHLFCSIAVNGFAKVYYGPVTSGNQLDADIERLAQRV